MTISTRVENIPAAPRLSADPTVQAEVDKAFRAAYAQSAVAERRRLVAIMALSEGAGREAMRNQLMLNTELSPEEVRELLEAVPATKPKLDNMFARAMAAIGNPPTIGLDGGSESLDPADLEAAAAAAILRNQAQR